MTRDELLKEACRYATSIATELARKHYLMDSPDWEPETGLMGVLTQIDNMTSGLTRTEEK